MSRRAAVLGSPIAHSRSPLLHNAAYAALGLDWEYTAIDVPRGQLGTFKAGLDDTWLGFSLTMPLKIEVLPLLDDITPEAQRIGAVNTVTVRDGRWLGSNTDVPAMIDLLSDATDVTDVTDVTDAAVSATVLGAGATARSALAALAHMQIANVAIWARRPEASRELAEEATALGLVVGDFSGPADETLLAADIVVNTLPADAAAAWSHLCPKSAPGRLLDAVYDPWPPPLTAHWPAEQVRSGFDLLLNQAARQVEIWTGQPAPRTVMADALLSTLPKQDLDRALH
jgi:shikimate dehydrogenase